MKAFLIAMISLTSVFYASSVFAGADDVAYFQQFNYRKEQIGTDPDFPEYQYRSVMTTWNTMFQLPDGRYLNPSMNLYIYDDGTYYATYRENFFKDPTDTTFMPNGCTKLTGKWSVPDKVLVLENLGYAERSFDQEKNALKITFTSDVKTPGIKSQSVEGNMGYANMSDQEDLCF